MFNNTKTILESKDLYTCLKNHKYFYLLLQKCFKYSGLNFFVCFNALKKN